MENKSTRSFGLYGKEEENNFTDEFVNDLYFADNHHCYVFFYTQSILIDVIFRKLFKLKSGTLRTLEEDINCTVAY